MKLLPLISKNTSSKTTTSSLTLDRSSSWPWQAYCHQPKTLSFRGVGHSGDLFRTLNSTFIVDPNNSPPDPTEEEEDDHESIETVIRGAQSGGHRLFFDPAGSTSSVLQADGAGASEAYAVTRGGSDDDDDELAGVGAMCEEVESRDPYGDFRASMEEMVEAHALRGEWDSLEHLLECYLRVKHRSNHPYILRAYVDLLLSTSLRPRSDSDHVDGSGCRGPNLHDNNKNGGVLPSYVNRHSSTSSPCSPPSFYTSSSPSTSCFSSSSESQCSTTPFSVNSVTLEGLRRIKHRYRRAAAMPARVVKRHGD